MLWLTSHSKFLSQFKQSKLLQHGCTSYSVPLVLAFAFMAAHVPKRFSLAHMMLRRLHSFVNVQAKACLRYYPAGSAITCRTSYGTLLF